MDGRRYPRSHSPALYNPGRSSLPVLGYSGYGDLHTVPIRREVITNPRSSDDHVNPKSPIVSATYNAKSETSISRNPSLRENSRTRRSTLDSVSAVRPHVVNAQARRPVISEGVGGPASPHRPSDETGEYYTIPASSGKYRVHARGAYNATMDNADMNKLAREASSGGMLRVGSGREGTIYSRPRSMYTGSSVRHHDTIDDYGDDGYGYTTPGDLAQYDLDRSARYPSRHRESFEESRSGRPSNLSGYADLVPGSFDARERGPPPSTRGFGKIAGRAPMYDPPLIRMPVAPVDPVLRSPLVEQFYETEPQRKSSYRRPVSVSVYNERDRDYEAIRDSDLRDRKEKRYHTKHYDGGVEHRGFGVRAERVDENAYDRKKEYEKRHDYDKHDDYDYDYEDRLDQKGVRDKVVGSKKDPDKSKDYGDYEDRPDRKREKAAASLSIAASALGLGAVAQDSRDHGRGDKESPRRRRDGEEHGKRRDPQDEIDPMDLIGRDPKEWQSTRDSKDSAGDGRDKRDKINLKGETPDALDLSKRNPRGSSRDMRDDVIEIKEWNSKAERADISSKPDVRGNSPTSDEAKGQRSRRDRGSKDGPTVPFNPKDTMDLRAVKDALAKQETTTTTTNPSSVKEPVREGSFDRRSPPEDRVRRDLPQLDDERRGPTPRLVSPPREETKKPEEKPVKGILRQPRERFPEDPMPVREGVAPLKDAKKEGIPSDARWTKINRRKVNPEALELGKERYEARDDFVIVLRVLSKEEVQAYADATKRIRAAREEKEKREEERRQRRRERHERHQRERSYRDTHEYGHDHRRQRKERDSHSESDTTPEEEQPNINIKRLTYDDPSAGALVVDRERDRDRDRDRNREAVRERTDGLREDPHNLGTYIGYVRNPPRK